MTSPLKERKSLNVLVLRHVPHEHLGTLALSLGSHNLAYEYVNLYENTDPNVSVDDSSALIILGGPMNVYETDKYPFLETEDVLIKRAIEKDIPVLGICLGAQLLAKSLDARVTKNIQKEIGWYTLKLTDEGRKDNLFKHLSNEEPVFEWHGDTFEIPRGAAHLAESPLCLNQAFRFGSSVYGLQFHMEVTHEMILEWLNVPKNRREIMPLKNKCDPEVIKAEIPKFIGRLNLLAKGVFQEFCALIK
jgi:GMP synthase-like glutamine amidotransferase